MFVFNEIRGALPGTLCRLGRQWLVVSGCDEWLVALRPGSRQVSDEAVRREGALMEGGLSGGVDARI